MRVTHDGVVYVRNLQYTSLCKGLMKEHILKIFYKFKIKNILKGCLSATGSSHSHEQMILMTKLQFAISKGSRDIKTFDRFKILENKSHDNYLSTMRNGAYQV